MSNVSNNRLPLYAQVENVIIERIANGSWPAGSRLPSEDSLVQEFAVSRTTIRAAISHDETYLPKQLGEKVMADNLVTEPIFLIERTSYSIGHRPVDYEKLHYRGDQIRFVTRLARRTHVLRKGGIRK